MTRAQIRHTLLDRILVRPRKRGKHKIARVGMPLVNWKLIYFFYRRTDVRHISQIELRIDALRK